MKVFLSHSHKDRDFVKRLASDLEKAGLEVWFSEWEMKPGESLVRKISEGLKESGVLVVVLSLASAGSSWVEKEISLGLVDSLSRQSTRVVPILLEDCVFPSSFFALGDTIYADFRRDYDGEFKRLLAGIGIRPSRAGLKAISEIEDPTYKLLIPGSLQIVQMEGLTMVWSYDRLTHVVSLRGRFGDMSDPFLEVPLTKREEEKMRGFRRKAGWGYYDVEGAGRYEAIVQISFTSREWVPAGMRWLIDARRKRALQMSMDLFHGIEDPIFGMYDDGYRWPRPK